MAGTPILMKPASRTTTPRIAFGGFSKLFFGLFFILFIVIPIIYAIILCFTPEGFNIQPGFIYLGNKIFAPVSELGTISSDILEKGFENYQLWDKVIACWGLFGALWTIYFLLSRIFMIFQYFQSDSKILSTFGAIFVFFALQIFFLLFTVPDGVDKGPYVTQAFTGLADFGKLVVMLIQSFQK